MNLSVVITDDEYLAIKVMEEYCSRLKGLDVTGVFTDPQKAIDFISDHKTDLLLLDIQMPYMNGFELVKKLADPPLIIFTTARHDYAVQAFELNVVDYLVKPVAFDRFEKAIQKAIEYYSYKKTVQEGNKQPGNFIMIRSEYRVIKLMTDDIIYIEGLNEYIRIIMQGKIHTTLAALKDMQNDLPGDKFIRIHKSYIVAVRAIKNFSSRSVVLQEGQELPVGRSYKNNFLKRMNK